MKVCTGNPAEGSVYTAFLQANIEKSVWRPAFRPIQGSVYKVIFISVHTERCVVEFLRKVERHFCRGIPTRRKNRRDFYRAIEEASAGRSVKAYGENSV